MTSWGVGGIFNNMTLTQTIDIPLDRRITLEVPREIPTGKVQFEYKIIPFVKKEETIIDNDKPPLKCLVGVKTPRSDRLLGAAATLGDSTLDELRDEWLTEKYLK